MLFLFLIGLLLLPCGGVQEWTGPDAQQAADAKPELAHAAEQLLRAGSSRGIAVAVVMAVIVAPLFEEFFFRVLLQGWLEAVWSRWRRKHRKLRAGPASWIPIVLPAVLFALMHCRASEIPHSPQYLTDQFLAYMGADSVGARGGDCDVAIRRGGDSRRSGLETGEAPLRRQAGPVGPPGRVRSGTGASRGAGGAGEVEGN